MTNSLGLFIRSPIMPEEDFGRYLARIGRLATKGKLPRAWLWPSGLGAFVDESQRFVGSRHSVREQNSSIPLVSRTMTAEQEEILVRHVFEQSQEGLMSFLGLSGPGSGWAKMTPARCPECMVEDIASGLKPAPFWRREHLVPGVLMCSRHKRPLHTTCDDCADFSQSEEYGVHPAAHCGCGLRPLPQALVLTDAEMEAETELAAISARLLNSDYLPNFRRQRIALEVRRAIKAHGLIKNAFVQWDDVLDFFRSSPHARLLDRVNVTIHRSSTLRQILVGQKVLRHPLQCIALLKALHGRWSAVEHVFLSPCEEKDLHPAVAAKGESVGSGKQVFHNRRWKERHQLRLFEHYRVIYRELRGANPEMTHTQLLRNMPFNARLFLTLESLAAAGEDTPASSIPRKVRSKAG